MPDHGYPALADALEGAGRPPLVDELEGTTLTITHDRMISQKNGFQRRSYVAGVVAALPARA
jgi:hypothetical protein